MTSSINSHLTLPAWDALDELSQERIAREVAARVDARFAGMAKHAQGQAAHRTATLILADEEFVLVPGARAQLGWDGCADGLTGAQRDAWTAESPEPSVLEFLRYYLTRSREVDVQPFLLSVNAHPVAPMVAEMEGAQDLHAAIRARVERDGFRLPTDDEWEHACRAGSTTLFRWGDRWPDGIPYGGETSFEGHRHPNAFGVRLLDDPYHHEIVAEPLGFRGGDGGTAICGGRPSPEAWYAFASAFRFPMDLAADATYEFYESAWYRRARALPAG